MRYTKQQLEHQFHQNEAIKYLFFWGHTPSKDGSISKSCLSQWWQADFEHEGLMYPTAEHWMMAQKARLFQDPQALEAILACKHPMEAKQWGRKVRNFDPVIWNQHRSEIVVTGNFHKFSQHEPLRTFLINTKNRTLVEASPRDRIWGIGMEQNHENATNPTLWRGQNLLGFALMEVRDMLLGE